MAERSKVRVELLHLPLATYQQAQEHHDEILREFSLMALGLREGIASTVPERLVALMQELDAAEGAAGRTLRETAEAAFHDGLEHLDVTLEVPLAARGLYVRLQELFDEVDAVCSEGALLALAAGPGVRALRGWHFRELVAQLDGAAPRPWTDDWDGQDHGEDTLSFVVPTPRERASSRFALQGTSAREARRFVAQTLEAWGEEELVPTAQLLTSEVVTNAVLHAHSCVEVSLLHESTSHEPTCVRVDIHDDNPSLPSRRLYSEEATTGRGLVLVEALSESWGVLPDQQGKSIWFRLGCGADL